MMRELTPDDLPNDPARSGHPEPFPYVVPTVYAVAEADALAHMFGCNPRTLPDVKFAYGPDDVTGTSGWSAPHRILWRNLRRGRQEWGRVWNRILDSFATIIVTAGINRLLKRDGQDRYWINTRNIVTMRKGDLYYGHSQTFISFICASAAHWQHERQVDDERFAQHLASPA